MSAYPVTIVSAEQWIERGPQGWSYRPGDPNAGRVSGWGHAAPSPGVVDGLGECLAVRQVVDGDGLVCTCGARAAVAELAAVLAIRVSGDVEDDPEWDAALDEYEYARGAFGDEDEGNGCFAPGREGPGLCPDDLCRGPGVCMYEVARR